MKKITALDVTTSSIGKPKQKVAERLWLWINKWIRRCKLNYTIHWKKYKSTDEVDEQISHNIFYTAITRARENLKIYNLRLMTLLSPEIEV